MVAVATAKALISRSDDGLLKSIDIENLSWARSLFAQMSFNKLSTISKSEILQGAVTETNVIFQHIIAKAIKDYSIPFSMVMNFGHTQKNTSLLLVRHHHRRVQSMYLFME